LKGFDVDSLAWIAMLLLICLPLYFISVYFNVAPIGCVMIRFEGRNPTVSDGFRIANENLKAILKWVLVSTIVGTILMIAERCKLKD
jgi:hypothetical protein